MRLKLEFGNKLLRKRKTVNDLEGIQKLMKFSILKS